MKKKIKQKGKEEEKNNTMKYQFTIKQDAASIYDRLVQLATQDDRWDDGQQSHFFKKYD
jgi:hypothetical protein